MEDPLKVYNDVINIANEVIIKKYIAFSPYNVDPLIYTADSLKELSHVIYVAGVTDSGSISTTIKKTGYGYYSAGMWEVVDTHKHPEILEEMKQWGNIRYA